MTTWEVIGDVTTAPYPLVVHLPHASTHVPQRFKEDLLLTDKELAREITRVTDHLTDRLFESGSTLGACFVNRISRLVFDPERFRSDEDEVMASRGAGVVYAVTTDGRRLRDEEVLVSTREQILADFYDPYALGLQRLVDDVLERFGRCLIVDAHSYPLTPLSWELHPDAARPPIAFGTDPHHTPPALVESLEEVVDRHGLSTDLNVPFAGTYVPLKHLNRDERVSSVMIEVRRDLYLDESTARSNAGFDGMKALVDDLLLAAAGFTEGWFG